MKARGFKQSFVTSADGTSIAIDTIGSGPGLVVLTGGLSPPIRYRRFARRLATSYTVHLVHRRGRGDSGPQGAAYSMDRECEDTFAALAATHSQLLFGHSYGGLIALQTAIRATSEQLSWVVTYDAGVGVDGSLPEFFSRVMRLAEEGKDVRALAELLRELGGWDRLPLPVAVALTRTLLNTVWRQERDLIPTTVSEGREMLGLDGPASAYGDISMRLDVLAGQRSPAAFGNAAHAIAEATPGVHALLLPGLDHNAPFLHPQQLAKQIRDLDPGSSAR
jgi:pimeloyl-ACP methyl ester carboxylesterase